MTPSPACGGGLGWGHLSQGLSRAFGAPPSRPSPASGGRSKVRLSWRLRPVVRGHPGPRPRVAKGMSAACLPPPPAGEGWGGGARRGGDSHLRRAPIPAFPRKRGKEQSAAQLETSASCSRLHGSSSPGREGDVSGMPPSPACGGGLGWGRPSRRVTRAFGGPHPGLPPQAGEAAQLETSANRSRKRRHQAWMSLLAIGRIIDRQRSRRSATGMVEARAMASATPSRS